MKETIPKAMDSFKPEFVVYNAGTDILKGDALGGLTVSREMTTNQIY